MDNKATQVNLLRMILSIILINKDALKYRIKYLNTIKTCKYVKCCILYIKIFTILCKLKSCKTHAEDIHNTKIDRILFLIRCR